MMGRVRAAGDFGIEAEVTTRGYTTRAKEEQRRTAAPVFTGRVRKWEKRWSYVGHMSLMRWERVEAEAGSAAPTATGQPTTDAPTPNVADASAGVKRELDNAPPDEDGKRVKVESAKQALGGEGGGSEPPR